MHTVCYQGHEAAAAQSCGGATNTNLGVAIRHAKLSIVANSLYPSQNDLDFIMCFRYTVYSATPTNLGINGATTLASSSVVNA